MLQGPGCGLKIESVSDPAPGPAEVIVEVRRSGVCGSDLSLTAKRGRPTLLGPDFERAFEPVCAAGASSAGKGAFPSAGRVDGGAAGGVGSILKRIDESSVSAGRSGAPGQTRTDTGRILGPLPPGQGPARQVLGLHSTRSQVPKQTAEVLPRLSGFVLPPRGKSAGSPRVMSQIRAFPVVPASSASMQVIPAVAPQPSRAVGSIPVRPPTSLLHILLPPAFPPAAPNPGPLSAGIRFESCRNPGLVARP